MGLLIKAGATLELRDKKGQTALMRVAESGRIEAMELLIEAGTDIEARNNYMAKQRALSRVMALTKTDIEARNNYMAKQRALSRVMALTKTDIEARNNYMAKQL